jgi:hypothetical protein
VLLVPGTLNDLVPFRPADLRHRGVGGVPDRPSQQGVHLGDVAGQQERVRDLAFIWVSLESDFANPLNAMTDSPMSLSEVACSKANKPDLATRLHLAS